MLLAIDVGNTNIALGLFDRKNLKYHWSFDTDKARSPRDLELLLKHLFKSVNVDFKNVKGVVLSNVVPALRQHLFSVCQKHFDQDPLCVTPETAKMPLRVDHPEEVGADRLCNAVAAWEKWKKPTIVVDFGTATTLDIITAKGEYGGGAIVPGMEVANLSLAKAAAKLPRVEIAKPKRVVGRNTVECIQGGLYYGTVGMVDHLIALSQKEEGVPMKVVATGGLASLIAEESKMIEKVEPLLTLEGLYFIWKKNV